MHELGIASDLIDVALAEARKHGARRIGRVDLLVGCLRGVVPEHLRFLFGHVANGTIAEGALLEVKDEPVRYECGACGPSEARGLLPECPACKMPWRKVEGGDSLRIVSIDIDTD